MSTSKYLLILALSMPISLLSGLELPDPLLSSDGQPVETVTQWEHMRRPELLDLFSRNVYGIIPSRMPAVHFDVVEESREALSGKAIRRQIRMRLTSEDKELDVLVLEYLPISAQEKAVPVFLLLNFDGNFTVLDDPDIIISGKNVRDAYSPPEEHRGDKAARFPVEAILERGYGLVTACYADFDPDFNDGFKNGVHALYDEPEPRPGDAWGSVGAWAWGLGRIMDYLEIDSEVDHERVAVLGHSRLGKTSLWAGAIDERFSIVISNDSGCTGAAIARNRKGETVKVINDHFPHWFCGNYKQYNDREAALPVDQHMLIALAAPRPVYVASASEDLWADPEGEFMACVGAEPVYRLYGLDGVGKEAMPGPEKPLNTGHIGYHLRTGKHDLTPYDWNCFMDFSGRHWNEQDE